MLSPARTLPPAWMVMSGRRAGRKAASAQHMMHDICVELARSLVGLGVALSTELRLILRGGYCGVCGWCGPAADPCA